MKIFGIIMKEFEMCGRSTAKVDMFGISLIKSIYFWHKESKR